MRNNKKYLIRKGISVKTVLLVQCKGSFVRYQFRCLLWCIEKHSPSNLHCNHCFLKTIQESVCKNTLYGIFVVSFTLLSQPAKLQKKRNVEECIFGYMALRIEHRFNKNYFLAILPKNTLLHTAFSAILPDGLRCRRKTDLKDQRYQ